MGRVGRVGWFVVVVGERREASPSDVGTLQAMILWGQESRSKRKIRRGWQLQTPHLPSTPPQPPLPPPPIGFHIVDNRGDFDRSHVLLTFHLLLLTFFGLVLLKLLCPEVS